MVRSEWRVDYDRTEKGKVKMAYTRKKSSSSGSGYGRNSGSGRGTTKRTFGAKRKAAPAKSGRGRVTNNAPQKLIIEIIQPHAGGDVSRPALGVTVKAPRKAQF